ncbi:hypothetical protein [Paraburkholderia sp. J94]|uniref:hypothetical protein n=1 Tax=Paraburkholderia sp. J94 TaxID=2805441 RepID=UPI002AB2115A|nr:hypothetical protein [Paraburkholderia sp. J94]
MKKSWSRAGAALMLSLSVSMALSTFAHAQDASAPAAANAPVQQAQAASTNAAWNNDGSAHITRAQVRHELVQAQQDGELKTLNSTLYAHH